MQQIHGFTHKEEELQHVHGFIHKEAELQRVRGLGENEEKLQQIQNFSSLLKSNANDFTWGNTIFHTIIHSSLAGNRFLCNLLLEFYGKRHGSLADAVSIFRSIPHKNVYTWNIFLALLVQHNECMYALQQFQQMVLEGIYSDKFTYSTVIDACETLSDGVFMHARIINALSDSHVVVATGLINMYSKYGLLAQAKVAFERVNTPDTILWSVIIDAFAKHGFEKISVNLFMRMQREQKHISSDSVTLISVLGACAAFSALTLGRILHSTIVDRSCETDLSVGNALLNMYAKCGDLDNGLCVFKNMPIRDVISWTAMISVYAQVGLIEESIHLFSAMQDNGISPNEITYVNILSACSHEGKVEEGLHYFVSVFQDYSMKPTSQHYGCLIDLYARAGRLEQAEAILRNSEVRNNAVIWQTLLGACRFHDDVERGKRAAKFVIKLDPLISASYVALSDFYVYET